MQPAIMMYLNFQVMILKTPSAVPFLWFHRNSPVIHMFFHLPSISGGAKIAWAMAGRDIAKLEAVRDTLPSSGGGF